MSGADMRWPMSVCLCTWVCVCVWEGLCVHVMSMGERFGDFLCVIVCML